MSSLCLLSNSFSSIFFVCAAKDIVLSKILLTSLPVGEVAITDVLTFIL